MTRIYRSVDVVDSEQSPACIASMLVADVLRSVLQDLSKPPRFPIQARATISPDGSVVIVLNLGT